MLALSCPRPRPNALPGPVGPGRAWGGAGQHYLPLFVSVLRPHLLTYIWCWSRCLGRCHRVLPLLCSSHHASSPGSPCSFSASEWAALPCPDPEVVQLPVSDLSSGPLPQPHPAPSFLCLWAPYAEHPPCSLGHLPPVAGTHGQHRTVDPSLGKAHIPPSDPYRTSAASRF